MNLLEAVRAEIDAEAARHSAAMERLNRIEEIALELEADVYSPSPEPPADPAPSAPGEQRAQRGPERVLEALADGPLTRMEIMERTGIPSGTSSGVLHRLEREGKIVRPDGRGGVYRLVTRLTPEPEPGEIDEGLVERVRGVLTDKRLTTLAMARELDVPTERVTDALQVLEERRGAIYDGTVWTAA